MAKEPLDPRYRPFRIAAWAVYFTVLLFFAGSICVSVIRSVLAMSLDHRSAKSPALSPEQCVQKARELWVDLDEHRKAMSAQSEVRRADADYWTQFRVGWLIRHRAAEEACAVDS